MFKWFSSNESSKQQVNESSKQQVNESSKQQVNESSKQQVNDTSKHENKSINEDLIVSQNETIRQLHKRITELEKENDTLNTKYNNLVSAQNSSVDWKVKTLCAEEKEYSTRLEKQCAQLEKSLQHYKTLVDDLTHN